MRCFIINVTIFCLALGLISYMSVDKIQNQSRNEKINQEENIITEPKLYGKIGNAHIEIAAESAKSSDNKVFLEEISATIYGENQDILWNLSTKSGIFDLQSKALFINQKLLLRSNKFNLESTSCEITLDSDSVVFYKPKVEIL